jgi:uncharacterized protein (DUF2236 family)
VGDALGGLFSPEQPIWRVNRESVLLLGGPRALLLQLAHPLVAAGVAAHSRFREQPIQRLRGTLEAMLTILFGTRAEAEATAARVRALHARVRGELPEATRAFPAGTPYDAADPALARWVHATLVDSALAGYGCFVRRLQPGERDAVVQESNAVATLFGVPTSLLFRDAADFDDYLDAMLDGPELEITPTGAELADAVLHPPLPLFPRFAGDAATLASVALLPREIRERYALPWGPRWEQAWRAERALVRRVLPLLPPTLRVMPHALRAERRLRRAAAQAA